MQQITNCPVCGTSLTPGQTFCGACGTKLALTASSQQSPVCPTCASPIKQGQQFCGVCGATLGLEAQQQWNAQTQPQAQTQAQQQLTMAQPGPGATPEGGATMPTIKPPEIKPKSKPIKRKNYALLLASITVLRIIGWITIICGFAMAALIALSDVGTDVLSKIAVIGSATVIVIIVKFLVVLLISVGYGFGLLAFAELCKVLLGIEDNIINRGDETK
jgi:uncharacterized Zn finger protein (UPF0148 family)